MSKDYDALAISQDAVAFAASRFGTHYIKRLRSVQQAHFEASMNLDFTDSYRANRASQAATIGKEIEYFQIARTIQKSPNMLAKLKKKLMGEEEPKV